VKKYSMMALEWNRNLAEIDTGELTTTPKKWDWIASICTSTAMLLGGSETR
jgi:hypothetical protein|tara:strand:- start:176 stop:328 length:153 start_codon:yes stop_codon:yes gene_type:complete